MLIRQNDFNNQKQLFDLINQLKNLNPEKENDPDLFQIFATHIDDLTQESAKKIILFYEELKKNPSSLDSVKNLEKIIPIVKEKINQFSETEIQAHYLNSNPSLLGKHSLANIPTPLNKKPKIESPGWPLSEKKLLETVIQQLQQQKKSRSLVRELKRALIDQDVSWRERVDVHGNTILHYLPYLSNEQTISEILSLTKNINVKNEKNQKTPLHYAFENTKLVELLLNKGADCTLQDQNGNTVFDYALSSKIYDTVRLLTTKYPNVADVSGNDFGLFQAIYEEDVELIKLLWECNPFPKYLTSNKGNIIYEAALEEPKILSTILQLGIPINFKNQEGSALLLACQDGNLELVKKLVEFGADIHLTNSKGDTPLTIAIEKNDLALFEYLLSLGVNVNQPVSEESPLCLAINHGRLLMTEHLLNKGADPNFIITFKDSEEHYPLYEYLLFRQHFNFRELALLKELMIKNGLEITKIDQTIHRQLLAHIWGIGGNLFFYINQKKCAYEGTFSCFTIPKLSSTFLAYLPQMQTIFPDYFTEEIMNKLYLSNQSMSFNNNFKESSSQEILEKSKIFPVILDTYWIEHFTSTVLYKNWLVQCNRGDKRHKDYSIVFYQINGELTAKHVEDIRKTKSALFFTETIHTILPLKKIETIQLKKQSVGNCAWANLKIAELASLRLLGNEHPNPLIRNQLPEITKAIYKSYTSHIREQELEDYFKSIHAGSSEIDWLLLARIRLQLEKKLARGKFIGLQKKNFEKALQHFQTYLTPEMCQVTKENKESITHYFIVTNNKKAINQARRLGLDKNGSYYGTTYLQTCQKMASIRSSRNSHRF